MEPQPKHTLDIEAVEGIYREGWNDGASFDADFTSLAEQTAVATEAWESSRARTMYASGVPAARAPEIPELETEVVTPAQQAALDRWAEIAQERAAIEEFIDWAQENGHATIRYVFNRSDLLDKFYGINRKDLEDARRALLEEARSKT